MTLLAKIARRRPLDLLAAAEALVLLGFFRVCLALIPVRRIIRAMTRGHPELKSSGDVEMPAVPQSAAEGQSLHLALRVRWAVEAVTRNSPADFVCFPQTLAGYAMLRRRKVRSTMVYGVARSPAGELIAHTWLTVGDKIVLGGEGAGQFTPVERWT